MCFLLRLRFHISTSTPILRSTSPREPAGHATFLGSRAVSVRSARTNRSAPIVRSWANVRKASDIGTPPGSPFVVLTLRAALGPRMELVPSIYFPFPMRIAYCFPRPHRSGGDDIQSRLEGRGQLFQRAALHFASQPLGEVCQEDDLFWSLIFCDSAADKISKFLLTTDDAVAQSHESNYLFSVDRVRHADDTSLKNCGMLIQNLLYFLRRDVGAAPDDDLL